MSVGRVASDNHTNVENEGKVPRMAYHMASLEGRIVVGSVPIGPMVGTYHHLGQLNLVVTDKDS
jgi:hypothetical protein